MIKISTLVSTILNVVGIILIIISTVIIIKNSKKEQRMYEEISTIHDDVKYYYGSLEKIIDNFDELVEESINKMEEIQHKSKTITGDKANKNKDRHILKDIYIPKQAFNDNIQASPKTEAYEKVYELKKLGLSNKEIAQKLKIGIREVEIIINMMEKI